MAKELDALVGAGNEALKAAQWRAAEEAFLAALDLGETGEALFGLGIARWWSGETEQSVRCWERAYAAFQKSAEPDQAVLTAGYLCLAYRMSLGNDAAARGWLAKASGLVEEFGLTPMRAWVLVCQAYTANDTGQPQTAEAAAREALDLARQAGDPDLVLCATSELGAALVGMGNLEEGATLLDQAMAGVLAGEASDLDSVVLVSCRTITSCSRIADIKRAVQWIRAAEDFNRRYGSTHLYTTCRTHYGAVLFAAGDWERAERELLEAIKIGAAAEPALHAEAAAKLAELRLAQGRVHDAERLLAAHEDQPATAAARAALQLDQSAPAVAASLIRRRLRDLDEHSVDRAALLDLLAEAEVAQGRDTDLARRLPGLSDLLTAQSELVAAYGHRAAGRGWAATDGATPVEHLEQALSAFGRLEMPYECGRTRVLLAQALAATDAETAIADARAALAAFEQLGAARDADAAAAALRSFGVKASRAGPKRIDLLTKREQEILALLGEGLSNPDIAERLYISRKTVEHHVASVLNKLGLESRAQAGAYSVRNQSSAAK